MVVLHATFSVPLHRIGTSFAGECPCPVGPRNSGQSCAQRVSATQFAKTARLRDSFCWGAFIGSDSKVSSAEAKAHLVRNAALLPGYVFSIGERLRDRWITKLAFFIREGVISELSILVWPGLHPQLFDSAKEILSQPLGEGRNF